MTVTTATIINEINSNFASTYRNAAPFVNSGALWDFCMEVLSDPILTQCIVFANDLEVPPVKSLIHLYKLKFSPADDFKFTQQQSQWLGALMAFIFKFVFGYKSQKERVRVNIYGIGGATRFYNGPENLKIQ